MRCLRTACRVRSPKARGIEPKSVLRGRFSVLLHQNPPEYTSMRSDFSLQYAKICSLKTAKHLSWAIFRGFWARRKQTGWRLSMTASRKASKIGHEGRFVFDSPRLKHRRVIRTRRKRHNFGDFRLVVIAVWIGGSQTIKQITLVRNTKRPRLWDKTEKDTSPFYSGSPKLG